MIIARKVANDEEKKRIISIIKQYGIDYNIINDSITYILEDNKNIIGGCNIVIDNTYTILNFLVIDKTQKEENLGEGLLRAMLNYCSLNHIEKIYFLGKSDYLLRKGFIEVKIQNKDLFKDFKTNSIIECDIEAFFSKGCSNTRS